MRLRPRLVLSHGLLVIWLALVLPLALLAIDRLARRTDAMIDEDMRAIDATEEVRQQLAARVVTLVGAASQPPQARQAAPEFPLRAAIEAARPHFAAPQERERFADFERRYAQFENGAAIWRAGPLRQPGAAELPVDLRGVSESLTRLRATKSAALHSAALAMRDDAHHMLFLLFALGLLALLLGTLLTLRTVRGVLAPVERLSALIRRTSAGDFEFAYRGGAIDEFNELERHFETMGRALQRFRDANLERILLEQRRMDAVLDSIDDGLLIFSEQGRIERLNAVAARQLGIEHDAALGLDCTVIGEARAGRCVRKVLDGDDTPEPGEAEFALQCDGGARVLEYSLHRFVESESGHRGVVMVLRDVTRQREFDKLRSEFVMRASHELRTPVTSVRMGIDLLRSKLSFAPGSREAELYDTIQHELKRMVALLTDLLDLSRMRAGSQNMERMPTDLHDVFGAAQQRFLLAAAAARVTLETQVETGTPRAALCRSAIDRVLDNLIGNALRHTPAGGNISLHARRTREHVAIEVRDSGEGVPYAMQTSIFEPFVQAGGHGGGAGLGLAICKEIVQQHGGAIRLASLPGRGATFTITLPA